MDQRDLEQTLRAANLRVTRQRLAVLRAAHTQPHADTNQVMLGARAEISNVSHQAIYDALDALTDAGLLRRIQPLGMVARYETRVGDNHHHIVCRSCGALADVDCAVGNAPCLTPSTDHNYLVDEAEVIYWGICPRCQASIRPSQPRKDAHV
ncbi:MAG: Fur family transcriptional regulator [Solirubrobacteraceae bacterium]